MKRYLYLVATPEAMIASMLPPEEFGNYMAVGTRKNLRGQVIFFELDQDKLPDLPKRYIEENVKSKKDGEPKRSVFLSIYRTFELTPLEALKNLYLTTDDGKVLPVAPVEYTEPDENRIRLYQQFRPIRTRIASKLTPKKFVEFLTDESHPFSTPVVFFADLKLGQLSYDVGASVLEDLPYPDPVHLKDCLLALKGEPNRHTKTVFRYFKNDLHYRTIENGFYIGDRKQMLYYPFPSLEKLEDEYYSWWRSALTMKF